MILTVDDEALQRAAEALREGQCVVMPTDTVYGIAANALQAEAVQRLLDAKQRSRDMPPPVLIAEPAMLAAVAMTVDDDARTLIDACWPGPLTIVVKAQRSLNMDLGETLGTIAVRVPNDDTARRLLRMTGPLAVSSANISGQLPATTAAQAHQMLADHVAVYLDDGPRNTSEVSTIVDLASQGQPRILREGALSFQDLHDVLPSIQPITEPSAEE